MKKIYISLLIIVSILVCFYRIGLVKKESQFVSLGLSTYLTTQGGTGTTTPSGILYGDNGATGSLKTVTIGSGCTFVAGTLSCPGTTFPFTVNSWGNSTTSTLGFLNGFLSTASSTISAPLRLSSLGQGFLFTGTNGLVQPIASSSIRLSWFNNDAGFITSAVTSVTGTYPIVSSGGNTPNITFSGLGTTTTWTAGQVPFVVNGNTLSSRATTSVSCSGTVSCTSFDAFGSSPITITGSGSSGSAFEIATTSGLSVSQLAYFTKTGGMTTLGGVATTTLVAGSNISLSGTPVILGSSPITISATGGSGSVSTSTVDWIVYNDGGTTKVYDTIANNVPTSGTFSAVMNWIVNKSTSTSPARVNTQLRSGTYTCDSSIIINGGSSRFGPNLIFSGNASSTTILVQTPKCFDFRNQATVNISHVAAAFPAGSNTMFYASSTAGSSVQSSLRESIFEDINFFSTTTGHTGYGFDLVGDFRNNYTHIMGDQVGNLWRSSNGYTNAQFINGDSHFMGFNFCELNNSGAGVCWDVNGNRGVVNQLVFDDINGISNDTGVNSNDILFRCTGSFGCSRVVVKGLNAEQFATTTQILAGNGVYIESSKYITPTTGGSPANKAIFETSSSAFNVGIQCKEIEVAAATTIFYDKNTLKTQPNSLQGINGANCIISDNGGSMRFATSTASIVRDVYDNVAGATWLSAIKVMGDKIVTNFSEAATDWISSIGSKMSFVVGGSERMSIADSGFGTTTVTGFTVNGSATSTANVGFNISTGCYAINNVCVGGGSGTPGGSNGQLQYNASGSFGGVSTTTFSAANSTLTITGTLGNLVGGSNSTIALNLGNANSWTALQTFANSSTTLGSFYYSSSTDAYFGTGQGIAYIGSGGRLRTTATSTFALSGFTNDLANLTALDTTLTFSGSYNGSVARTVGLNLGNANTWTVNQTFNYSSSTVYSSFINSSTTNARIGTLTLSTTTAGTLKVTSSGVVWSDTSGGGSGYTTIQDEGSGLTARSILNFTGSGVNCVDNSGSSRTDCTINAGAATAGGSNKQLQFNDSTALGGASGLEWDKNAGELSLASGNTLILGATATSSTSTFEVIKDGILGWFASTTGATIRPILNIFRNTTTGISGIGINSSTTEDALTVNGFANFDPQMDGCDAASQGASLTSDQLAGNFCDWAALDSITDGGILQDSLGRGTEVNMPFHTVLRTGDTTSWAANEGVWIKTQRGLSATTTLIAEILLRNPNTNISTTTGTYMFGLANAGSGSLTTTAAYANTTNMCAFQASSTANWIAIVKRNGTFNEYFDTGISTSSTQTTFRRFRITQDYVNGCKFFVDGTQVASETAANSPVVVMQVVWGIGNNGAGTGTVGTSQNHYFMYAEPKIGWGRWQPK